jgi:hypothetical protein
LIAKAKTPLTPNSSFIKPFALFLLFVGLAGCGNQRYKHVQRGEVKQAVTKKTPASSDPVGAPVKHAYEATSPILTEKPATNADTGKEENKSIPSSQRSLPSIVYPTLTTPDDSIEIDIKEETRIAEKYGNLGYKFGVIGIACTFLFFLGALLSIPGLYYSGVALYKMKAYELEVRNRQKIITGFFLNLITFLLLAGGIAAIIFVIYFL